MTFGRFVGGEDSKLVNLARTAVADAFPNPDRIDCPDAKMREDLALRKERFKDHWELVEHICSCSPCFLEHLTFRRRIRRRSTALKALLLILGFSVAYAAWTFINQRVEKLTVVELRQAMPRLPGIPNIPSVTPVIVARLDYSMFSVARAPASRTAALNTPVLGRGRLSLTIELPTLTPPGAYRIAIRGRDGLELLRASARAIVVRGATTLGPMEVDTTTAAPGPYTLTVLRDGASTSREFPVRIE